MNWTELLKSEVETTYTTTTKLLDKVDPGTLQWKPATGINWMSMGQLLMHISSGCGAGFKGFVMGDWGLPDGKKLEDLPPDEILPPAEKLPTIGSVEQAKNLLAEDRTLALEMIDRAGESDLENRMLAAPWAPSETKPLGQYLLMSIQHLERHKSQLFYYLKLQGKAVDTTDLWG